MYRSGIYKGKIEWNNYSITFFPDGTKQIADLRKHFGPLIKELIELDVCFHLAELAMLQVMWNR